MNDMYPHTMRLQRFLARAGVASRRGSETLMTSGRVSVNGVVVTELGTKVDCDHDVIEVDGKPVCLADEAVYIMLNKPANYLTTMSDPQGRKCVAELVPTDIYPGLFPVGRLDRDTTGLLLFTTDGDMAQSLLHPSHHVNKTYRALVDGDVVDRELDSLRKGIVLDDGPCQPAKARIMKPQECKILFRGHVPENVTPIEIVIHEGRKNQVKRMLGRIHHPVLRLHRVKFGPLDLTSVKEGKWRVLTSSEISALRDATKGDR